MPRAKIKHTAKDEFAKSLSCVHMANDLFAVCLTKSTRQTTGHTAKSRILVVLLGSANGEVLEILQRKITVSKFVHVTELQGR